MKYPLGAFKPQKRIKFKGKDFLIDIEAKQSERFELNLLIEEFKTMDNSIGLLYSNSINFVKILPKVRNQGSYRNSCTAFSLTACNEFKYIIKFSRKIDLSEQYLFYETKKIERNRKCGAYLKSGLIALKTKGQCQDSLWSYNPNLPCVTLSGKPSRADENALSFRSLFVSVNPKSIRAFKLAIKSKRLIAITISVYESWYKSKNTQETGIIKMPLRNEKPYDQGHSLVIVGYQDNNENGTEGYFIIRNSWGQNWGRANIYESGYGQISYKYIQKYCWEAYIIK